MSASPPPSINAARSALLSMDFQVGVVQVYSKDPGLTPRAAAAIAAARIAGVRIIHVKVGFRPKLPEVNARNPLLRAIKASVQHQRFFEGETGMIHPDLAPEPDDIVITKARISAFTGTDLDLILRANEIETLVLFGIATSGVVLSTLLHASDADYRLVVIKDCCADLDLELHTCLLERFFPLRATVLSAEQFLQGLTA